MITRIASSPPVSNDLKARFQENFEKRFKPALIRQPGFVAGFWLESSDGGTRSVTVWESEELMEKGGKAANSAPLLPGFTEDDVPGQRHGQTSEIFEVIYHHIAKVDRG